MILTMSSELVEDSGTRVLVQCVILLLQLFLEEGEVLHDGGTVTDVALAHSFLLSCIFVALSVLDSIVGRDGHILAKASKLRIARVHVNANLHTRRVEFA